MIHAKEALDRETQSYYWLTVYAHDSAAVPRSSFVDVLIEVDDVNDNRPQTAQPVYYPSVPEGSRQGTEVIQLQAFDHDVANGGLSYDITSGNPQGFFAIDRSTGTLPCFPAPPLPSHLIIIIMSSCLSLLPRFHEMKIL